MQNYKKLLLLSLFAAAFGYLEASVVIYLRELYYPGGFNIQLNLKFPFVLFGTTPFLNTIPHKILFTEIAREASTILILITTAVISGVNFRQRLAFFLFSFALWDISYYFFLKLLTGWPASFLTLDVLFLIPVPWIAPVFMPILFSAVFIAISLFLLKNK